MLYHSAIQHLRDEANRLERLAAEYRYAADYLDEHDGFKVNFGRQKEEAKIK